MHLLQALAGALEGLQDPGTVKGLEQVIDGVDVEGAHRILVESSGKNDLRHALGVVPLQQLLEHGKAVQARHLHIQKHHIRMVSANQVDRLNAILALGDDLHPARGVQQVFELLARKPFIVDDQRSHGHVIGGTSYTIMSIGSGRKPGQCGRVRIGRHAAARAYYPKPDYGRNRRSRSQ